ncbi:MAG: serine/threonine-protein kinase, partial [Planctomycetota bacterium]
MGQDQPPGSSPGSSEAEDLFAAFLGELESGRAPDFEELCGRHPEHAAILRELWEERDFVGPLVEAALPSGGSSLFGRHESGSLPPAAGLEPGAELGEFRLIEVLGEGGMGQVWCAEQRSLGRRVALKLIRPGRVSERALELFAREARAGARLSHPGIVTVYGRGTTDGRAWIAMELILGSWTLRDHLHQVRGSTRGPQDHRKSAECIAQVADALHHAHSAGVIHRDVKPQNILVDALERPRLTDFGLARIVDEASLSQTGDLLGTYYYMSPEQVAARRSGIDFRTDIFSLGVVLYEMLALRRPFEGETTHQIADQILAYDPPDLRTLGEHIPSDLAVICAKAMQKGRRHRYQTMAEMAADLRRHLDHVPILARPLSPPARAARWVRRHTTVSAAAGAALAVAATVWVAVGSATVPFAPFSGPDTVRKVLISGPALDTSPTFAGPGQLVYERRETAGAPPALWQLRLREGLRPAPLTAPGSPAGTPAASPDGRWLAHVEPVPEELQPEGLERGATRLVISALERTPQGILSLGTDPEVLAVPGAWLGGAHWAPDSLHLVYTRRVGSRSTLVLHQRGVGDEGELATVENVRFPGIPASFSPDGGRVAFVLDRTLQVVDLAAIEAKASTWVEDLRGECRDLVWLNDGRLLLTCWSPFEAELRMMQLVDGELRLLESLELQGVGDSYDLAVDPTGERLAWVGAPNRVELRLLWCPEAPAEILERVDYSPYHPVWTPDG